MFVHVDTCTFMHIRMCYEHLALLSVLNNDHDRFVFPLSSTHSEVPELSEEGVSSSPIPQPATVTTTLPDGRVVRTSDLLVSQRTPMNEFRLKPFGPIYNQFTGDVSLNSIIIHVLIIIIINIIIS